MRIGEQLNTMATALREQWLPRTLNQDAIKIASDPLDLFGLFSATAPQGLRAVIMFTGETTRGVDGEVGGFVDRKFMVVVTTGKAMLAAGDATRETPSRKPLYELVEGARDTLRNATFSSDTTEGNFTYNGASVFVLPDGMPVDALQLEFTLGTQLPATESTE